MSNQHKGFTLIEVLLVVVLVGFLAGMGVPVYHSLQTVNNLDIAAAATAQNLRRAQVLATSVEGDSSWGVLVQSGNITIFKGPSYFSRDSAYDEIFEITSSIAISGSAETVFSKFTGLPQVTGSIVLTASNNDTRTITINTKGTVGY